MAVQPHPPHDLPGPRIDAAEHLADAHGAAGGQVSYLSAEELDSLHNRLHEMGAGAAVGREASAEDLLARVGRRIDRLERLLGGAS